jgi:hypothetical protein
MLRFVSQPARLTIGSAPENLYTRGSSRIPTLIAAAQRHLTLFLPLR